MNGKSTECDGISTLCWFDKGVACTLLHPTSCMAHFQDMVYYFERKNQEAKHVNKGAPRALCPRCAKSRLFSITGSHGSQGLDICTLQPLLVHQGFFLSL